MQKKKKKGGEQKKKGGGEEERGWEEGRGNYKREMSSHKVCEKFSVSKTLSSVKL